MSLIRAGRISKIFQKGWYNAAMSDTIPQKDIKSISFVAIRETRRLLEKQGEKSRHLSLAITKLQEAEMWLREDLEEAGVFQYVIAAYNQAKAEVLLEMEKTEHE